MHHEKLEKSIHGFFSDNLMMFLAILVIPLLLVQFVDLNPMQKTIVLVIDWFIYGMFLLEFVLKVAVAQNKIAYIKTNRMDSIISIVIIISPIFELITFFFAATTLLRLLRISRIVRLGGILGKTGEEWKKIDLKSYLIVIVITSVGIVMSFFAPGISVSAEDAGWLSVFISVIGIVYALIAAFMIVNVWQEYNNLEDLLRKETGSIRTVYIMGGHLDSQVTRLQLRSNILEYIKIVKEAYWRETRNVNDINKKLTEIIEAIKLFEPRNGKEEVILNNIYGEIRETAKFRVDIDTLVETKTPSILWVLLIILSLIVFLGFYIVNFEDQLICTLTITMTAAATAVVIIIIYDIDYPFRPGFWRITPEQYEELEKFINETQPTPEGAAIIKPA